MDKTTARNTIEKTFKAKFDKIEYGNFIRNLLDEINEEKAFNCGNAQVKESYRDYVSSYSRIGQYTDPNGKVVDVLSVHLKNKTTLYRARTLQRNFIADYMKQRQKENVLVAFYNEDSSDWRFSFVKLDIDLKENANGGLKIENHFTSAKRYSFLVGEQEPNHTAQSRLIDILVKQKPTLEELEEAFNIEKVSKEFFEKYKLLFLDLVENLKKIRAEDKTGRINSEFILNNIKDTDFCKKLMGQLVFLYFLQKKGWLGVKRDEKWGDGDKQFLRHTFDRAVSEGKNFFNDYLEPLFYEALANGERDDNWFRLLDCKIPFLNGGLFEPIGIKVGGYDWVNTDIIFDNDIFSNDIKTKEDDIGTGILDVFDRYNFTVKEDEPLEKEVAVDPEMLGKVFEELLEVKDRKSKGAFYTPREIVHYMCQESLINYLSTELNAIDEDNTESVNNESVLTKKALSDFIHYGDRLQQNESLALEKEKLGDLGKTYDFKNNSSIRINAKEIDKALQDIKICDPAIGSGAFPVGMMSEIVRARLTLLEAGYIKAFNSVEEKEEYIAKQKYLYKREAIQNSIYGVDIDCGAIDIAKLRLWLSLIVDEEDIENIQPLPNLDYKIVCGNSLLGVERNLFNDFYLQKLEELKPKYFAESNKKQKREYKKQIDETIKELTKDGTFDFEIYFSEVFHENGGFDIVIANPPYIDSETMVNEGMKDLRELIVQRYQWTRGNWDIYIAFFEKGFNLLKNSGNMIFITPDKWLARPFGENMRLKVRANILSIMFAGREVFESAIVDSVITNIQKMRTNGIAVNKYFDKKVNYLHKINIENLLPPYTLDFLASNKINLLSKIEKQPKRLQSLCECQSACATSDAYKLKPLIISLSNTNEYNEKYYKTVNTGTIGKYYSKWASNKIKYLKDDYYFPVVLKSSFHDEFGNSYSSKVGKPKLIIKGLTLLHSFLDIEGSCIPCKSTLVIQSENIELLKFIMAIINCKLSISYIQEKYASASYNGGISFNKDMINNLPLPSTTDYQEKTLISQVDNIIQLTQSEDYLENQEKQNTVKEYEKQIDLMVYKLYELDYSEVLVVDTDFKMSEQDYNHYELPVTEEVQT